MIYDCVAFFKEFDLLELRLNMLNHVVDKFVICESDTTFSGKPKPLYFAENQSRYSKFKDKIIYKTVDLKRGESLNDSEIWNNEFSHRKRMLPTVFEDDDVIITSDLDEIPDPDLLTNTEWVQHNTVYHLNQKFYYYNLRSRLTVDCLCSRMCRGSVLKKFNAQEIRFYKTNCQNVQLENAGWHYSYFGDSQFIRDKIEAFSHSEYNYPVYKDNISENVSKMRDIFSRDGVFLREVPIDLANHPKYVVENINSELIQKFI